MGTADDAQETRYYLPKEGHTFDTDGLEDSHDRIDDVTVVLTKGVVLENCLHESVDHDCGVVFIIGRCQALHQ